jgi:hypothetical protein
MISHGGLTDLVTIFNELVRQQKERSRTPMFFPSSDSSLKLTSYMFDRKFYHAWLKGEGTATDV